jgi:hypothetical protein
LNVSIQNNKVKIANKSVLLALVKDRNTITQFKIQLKRPVKESKRLKSEESVQRKKLVNLNEKLYIEPHIPHQQIPRKPHS